MVNYHTHTHYCDGSDRPSEYASSAVAAGFSELGFSGHAPVPFNNGFAIAEGQLSAYCEEILALKPAFGHVLKIWLGLEIDYIPGVTRPFEHFRQRCNLDYVIGSVHLVKPDGNGNLWFIDGPEKKTYDEGLATIFGGDIRLAVTAYFHQLNEMIDNQRPDILGHADKIKMHNAGRYFNETESWYQALVDETLALVKETGVIVEVNSRGLYKKRSTDFFPGEVILRKMKQLNIPLTISSDAHRPEELTLGLSEAQLLVESLGFRQAPIHPFIQGFV